MTLSTQQDRLPIKCTLSDGIILVPDQIVKCQLHKYHRLREPTLTQTIEALIYTHNMPGHVPKRSWRRDLAKAIAEEMG